MAHDVMNRTGLSRYGQEDDGVRWVAIRHAEDYVHIVAILARQDRSRAQRAQRAVPGPGRLPSRRATLRAAVHRPGRPHRAPLPHPGRERESRPARPGRGPRVTLRRHVTTTTTTTTAASASATEFFARLDQAGVLVRTRYSTGNPGQVIGYAVALPR